MKETPSMDVAAAHAFIHDRLRIVLGRRAEIIEDGFIPSPGIAPVLRQII